VIHDILIFLHREPASDRECYLDDLVKLSKPRKAFDNLIC
jgi:hypothetical protein